MKPLQVPFEIANLDMILINHPHNEINIPCACCLLPLIIDNWVGTWSTQRLRKTHVSEINLSKFTAKINFDVLIHNSVILPQEMKDKLNGDKDNEYSS